jgi:hypothetical protein
VYMKLEGKCFEDNHIHCRRLSLNSLEQVLMI